MAKVMDIFRGRASIPGQTVSAEVLERRRAVSYFFFYLNSNIKEKEISWRASSLSVRQCAEKLSVVSTALPGINLYDNYFIV